MARPVRTAVAAKPAKAPVAKAAAEKVKKVPAAKKVRSHPPYYEMVKEAIAALKERTGSSGIAIAKYVEDNHGKNLPENFKKLLSVQLKKFVASGKLVKVKNSFKLGVSPKPVAAEKKPKKPVAAEKKEKETLKRKRTPAAGDAPAAAAKKSPAKKGTPVKKAPTKKVVKPKSIKSPAAKKAKK